MFGTPEVSWNLSQDAALLPTYRTLEDCRFENYMAFFPSQLGDSGLNPKREGGGCRALRDRNGAGSGSQCSLGPPGQGVGWLDSSKWKLSVPCFSLYCLSAAQVFADRLVLFTKTPGLEVRSGGPEGAWHTCMGHPVLHPQHLELRLWLALSSFLAT